MRHLFRNSVVCEHVLSLGCPWWLQGQAKHPLEVCNLRLRHERGTNGVRIVPSIVQEGLDHLIRRSASYRAQGFYHPLSRLHKHSFKLRNQSPDPVASLAHRLSPTNGKGTLTSRDRTHPKMISTNSTGTAARLLQRLGPNIFHVLNICRLDGLDPWTACSNET